MKSTKKWTNALWILNVIYLIVLTWLILLKGSVSLRVVFLCLRLGSFAPSI